MRIFVKDFSGTTWPRILKLSTKLGNEQLYCVLKNQPHIAYQSLYLSIFLSLLAKFSVTDFSASIIDRVFKFYIHDEDNQMYYWKQNQGAEIYFCLLFPFFLFSISPM